jgi:hypothetical protein
VELGEIEDGMAEGELKEEGRRKKEEGRRKKEERRKKKEERRRKKEERREKKEYEYLYQNSFSIV